MDGWDVWNDIIAGMGVSCLLTSELMIMASHQTHTLGFDQTIFDQFRVNVCISYHYVQAAYSNLC